MSNAKKKDYESVVKVALWSVSDLLFYFANV